jgi:NAD(P)-dependent dehydrogenase (short-subunit alcohol dehydrogenase family)
MAVMTERDLGSGTVVVTGASRGIGRSVAVEFANRGYRCLATMRNVSDGDALPTSISVARLDVTNPEPVSLPGDLSVIVNNAGVETDNLPVEHCEIERHWKYLFEANVFGLARVCAAAIPILRSNGGGVICNVTSSSILAPVPFLGMYRASKAAVSAMCESLQAEVRGFGIRVVEILPGPIVTDMLLGGDHPAEAIEYPEYRAHAQRMFESRAAVRDAYTPSDVAARRIVDAIEDRDGPMRYGCDPVSDGLLAGWRATPHDTFFEQVLGAML